MRQLQITVPEAQSDRAFEVARSCGGVNLSAERVQSPDGPRSRITAYLPNNTLEDLVAQLEDIGEVAFVFFPQGVFVLYPPAQTAPEELKNVCHRSPLEVFLSGLQSVGSWQSFIAYAAVAGIVVWLGLFANKIYLLIAAMLIAPFAGPALNSAIASARGDWPLLRKNLLRYFVSILVTIGICFLLSWVFQQKIATTMMISLSEVSQMSLLLPLAAGAVGALHLIQSERSNLVTGAGTGLLIAASLAPPAGLIGMSLALQEWGLVQSGVFLILLQLLGIQLAGILVFRFYGGLKSRGPRYQRGNRPVFGTTLAATIVLLAGMLVWQLANPPEMQRSTLAQRIAADIQTLLNRHPEVEPIEVNARFTRADIAGQNTLLGVVYVQRRKGVAESDEGLREDLARLIQSRIREQGYNVTPVVDVNVLDPPPG